MLSGVIEGFYGRAWTESQRREMLDWIGDAGMNMFIYAPKDDIHIRARWREPYGPAALSRLVALREAAETRDVDFMVAIAPCLDITYSDPQEIVRLNARIDQLIDAGIANFTLLFDDIPNRLPDADQPHFSNFAEAQCHVANAAYVHMRARGGKRMIFCPTEYCGRFARNDVPGSDYLNTLGARLDPEIDVFWTGPKIVSETITADSLKEIGAVLRRKPVIWENFHANDYDVRRVMLGPLAGRDSDILPLISGFITNPNNEFDANFVPVHTTGQFVNATTYNPQAALDAALRDWQPFFSFAFGNNALGLDEIHLLVDLFYQPFTCGPQVEEELALARDLLGKHRPNVLAESWQDGLAELRDFKERIVSLAEHLTEIENRDLFYALGPYVWEAREEITHLIAYLDWLADAPGPYSEFPGRERIYNFYRRGFGVAVQEILKRDSKGRYFHDLEPQDA